MPDRASWMEAGERRHQIIDVATGVFASRSYSVATTVDVAREAGVSQATIFKYFPTKRDLFVAVLERTTELVLERWGEAAAAGPTPLDGLLNISRKYARMAGEEQVTFRVRIRAVAESADPVIAEAARTSYQTIIGFLRDLITAAREAGQLPSDVDPATAAWYFLSVGQGFNLNHFVGFNWDDSVLDQMVIHLFRGVGVPPDALTRDSR